MTDPPNFALTVDGRDVTVPDDGSSLLDVLRERLGLRSAKDGCSPQGQCGCCTVLVDGQPRVACVTPARRVRGRAITTLDGLDPADRQAEPLPEDVEQAGPVVGHRHVPAVDRERKGGRVGHRPRIVGVQASPMA